MPYMSKHYFYPYQILLQFIYFCMLVKIKCSDPLRLLIIDLESVWNPLILLKLKIFC